MDLQNVDLLQLMTECMKSDLTTQGLCAALNPQVREIATQILLLEVYKNIDSITENILDELAWQFHIDFYDVGNDLETKRKLVKSAIEIHKTKGTPYAVKKLVQDVFGYGELWEWFQYGGSPYAFKVAVDYSAGSADNIRRFNALIDSVKNIRSKLEAIELTIRHYIKIEEKIYKTDIARNTKLGVWRLGVDPFATAGSEVEVK